MLGWATLPPMDGFSVLSALLRRAQGRLSAARTPMGYANPEIERLTREGRGGARRDQAPRHDGRGAARSPRTQALIIPLHLQPVAWAARQGVDVPQFPDEYVRLWFAQVK